LLEPFFQRRHGVARRQQRVEPRQCSVGRIERAGEALGGALGSEREAGCAGEGRGGASGNPRQEIAPFGGVPRAGQFGGLEPGIVLRALVFLRKVTDMDPPQPSQ
jgi:hypothetical protein